MTQASMTRPGLAELARGPSQKPGPLPSAPQLLAVASGKGGVGKTWLSITLSHAMARAGRRVLLFDGDLGLANVDVQLGLAAERDIAGVLSGRYSLAEAAVDFPEGGFQIVAGRSGTGSLAAIPSERLRGVAGQLLRLAPSYDRVLLDLGAGIEKTVRQIAGLAGTCLVVTNDEPTALTDAYAFIKLSVLQNREADLRVVVNQAASAGEGERTYNTLRKACETFLKVTPPLAGVIRRDPRVKESIRSQTPLLLRHPTTQAAVDVERLAQGLLRSD